jgi:hypothetical protein
MWTLLREAGVRDAIATMREKFVEAKSVLEDAQDRGERKRASEVAMEEAVRFKTRKFQGDLTERNRESLELVRREVERRSVKTNVLPEIIQRALELEISEHPFVAIEESLPGAPFYRVVQFGGQLQLLLNTAHRFYTDVYKGPSSSPAVRASLEVLLFVLGQAELDSDNDRRTFYKQERSAWSGLLDVALERLGAAHPAGEDSDEASSSAA